MSFLCNITNYSNAQRWDVVENVTIVSGEREIQGNCDIDTFLKLLKVVAV
jgi:hypothetical protein